MTSPTVVQLVSIPQGSAHLGFRTSGIIEDIPVSLGQTVNAVDFEALYSSLSEAYSNEPGILVYDSTTILNNLLQGFVLARLRAPRAAAHLDSAILARANSYYTKYANQPSTVAALNEVYFGVTLNGVKLSPGKRDRLVKLRAIAQTQRDTLDTHYAQAGLGTAVPNGDWVKEGILASSIIDQTVAQNGGTIKTSQSNSPDFFETQTVGTSQTVPTYPNRIPMYENYAVNQRAQLSLADEYTSCLIQEGSVQSMDQIYTNELQIIDLNVKQLQLAYIETLLLSPIPGVVTAITKTPGSSVSSGEALIRVEDNNSIFVAGTITTRAMITAGQKAIVTTALFGDPSQPTTITGTVVAVEGRPGAEDQCDIVVACDNTRENGTQIIPLHYSFSFDATSIVIS